ICFSQDSATLFPSFPISNHTDWLFDLSGQSVSLPSFSRRRKIQECGLDRDWVIDRCALVPWKPWGLAILVSLRHHSASLDVSLTGRQRLVEYFCYRSVAIHRLSSD